MWMSMLCEGEVPQLHATGQPHTFVLKKQYFSSKFYNKSLIGSQKRFLTCATWLFVAGDRHGGVHSGLEREPAAAARFFFVGG